MNTKYGSKTGALGDTEFKLDVIPTGSLALDYALGTGGWPRGHPIHLFGEPDIGKSSTLGMAALCNAQAMGLKTGMIAVEPGFDPAWAEKNGVDPTLLLIARPNDGYEAFKILKEWISEDKVDFIIFDSIGAVVHPKEAEDDGKAQVGGASNLITSGIRSILMPTWKKNKGLIFLNQIRDDMKSSYGGVKPPGGRLLTHACDIWVHLRQSSGSEPERFRKIKEGRDDIVVGRNLTAAITRNKLCEGTGKRAKFWYNLMETAEFGPVGLDAESDIIASAIRSGIISKGGGWYGHESFPGESHKLNGESAVKEFLAEHPGTVAEIRESVLQIMMQRGKRPKHRGPNLDAYDRAAAEVE